MKPILLILALEILLTAGLPVQGASILFSGYEWNVRSGRGGPGPNSWEERNVWLDDSGALHLKIRHSEGQWSCAEVTLQKRLGFGRYEFQVAGRIDNFDENVVLGLFNYPPRGMGPDATHEIDIEFARWGNAKNPIGNYTVWPVEKGLKQQSKSFPITLQSDQSTHRFSWTQARILFQSLAGYRSDDGAELSRWEFKPENPTARISQQPMPVHLNLWLFKGRPPNNGQEVEIVLRRFTFTPE
jgi:hypothetical protein